MTNEWQSSGNGSREGGVISSNNNNLSTNDVASVLRLVQSHHRQHSDGTFDATTPATLQRCLMVISKLRKVIPKLMRLIGTAPNNSSIQMLNDMCQILHLVSQGNMCPHSLLIFKGSGVTTKAHEEHHRGDFSGHSMSPPSTLVTILLHMVSFYSNHHFRSIQLIVLSTIRQLLLLLQRDDVYCFLHFFRDTVDLLEDSILVIEYFQNGRCKGESPSIASYLDTAIHAYHGSDGALGSKTCASLCGCVSIDTSMDKVYQRKEELKKLLPTIQINTQQQAVDLSRSVTLLVMDILAVKNSIVITDRIFDRLAHLVAFSLKMVREMLETCPTSKENVRELAQATLELVKHIVLIGEHTERIQLMVIKAFFENVTCDYYLSDFDSIISDILIQITILCPRLTVLVRDEQWISIAQWKTIESVADYDGGHQRQGLICAIVRLLTAFSDELNEVSPSILLTFVCKLDVLRLSEDTQNVLIDAVHAVLSSKSHLILFVQCMAQSTTFSSHIGSQSIDVGEQVRKRRRLPRLPAPSQECLQSRPSLPLSLPSSMERFSEWLVRLVFCPRIDYLDNIRSFIVMLRMFLPFRLAADTVANSESMSITRLLMLRIGDLLKAFQEDKTRWQTSESAVFLSIILTYFEDNEVFRFRTFIVEAISHYQVNELQSQELDLTLAISLSNEMKFLVNSMAAPSERLELVWGISKLEHVRRCDYLTSYLTTKFPGVHRVVLLIYAIGRAKPLRMTMNEWTDVHPGDLIKTLCLQEHNIVSRSMLPLLVHIVTRKKLQDTASVVVSVAKVVLSDLSTENIGFVRVCIKSMCMILCTVSECQQNVSRTLFVDDVCGVNSPVIPMERIAPMVRTLVLRYEQCVLFEKEVITLAGCVLRHCKWSDQGVASDVVDVILHGLWKVKGGVHETSIHQLQLIAPYKHIMSLILFPSVKRTMNVMDSTNEQINIAVESHDVSLLKLCIEVIGVLCCSNASSSEEEACNGMIWGVLHLLILWINSNGTRSALSAIVYDQVQAIFRYHDVTCDRIFERFPEDVYFVIMDGMLRAQCVQLFLGTFMTENQDISDFAINGIPYVLPQYVISKDKEMMYRFLAACNGETEDHAELHGQKMTMTQLLEENIDHVLKELVLHQIAEENTDKEKKMEEWQFLFQYLRENSTIRDVMTHSPLRLLNLLAWELGGDRYELAKRSFREISHYLNGDDEGAESELVMPREYFLAIMTDLGPRILKKGEPSTRVRAIRCITRLLSVIRRSRDGNDNVKGALDPFVPKLMAILKMGMVEQELQEHAVQAWDLFVRMLTPRALEANFVSIVVSVLPLIGSSDKSHKVNGCNKIWSIDCVGLNINTDNENKDVRTMKIKIAVHELLRYLFIERRADLKQAFPRIMLLPTIPEMDDIHAVILSEIGDVNRTNLAKYLVDVVRYISHWDMAVCEIALSHLYQTLVTRAIELQALMQPERDIFVDSAVVDVLFAILVVARTHTAANIRLLCSKCLGALGAVDGARIPLNMLHISGKDKVESKAELSTKDLAYVLIEVWLVKELRAAPEHTDSIGFAIQELLKFLAELSADPQHSGHNSDAAEIKQSNVRDVPMPEWVKRRLERKDVLQFVEPYWSTNYVVKDKLRSSIGGKDNADRPLRGEITFYERFGTPYETWLESWCKRLIHLSQPPERKIFWACRLIVEKCPQIGRFLLPYLIQNVLRSGRSEVYDEVKREVMAILKDDGVMEEMSGGADDNVHERAFGEYASRHHQCVQTIFSTIDDLNEWVWNCEKKRYALSGNSGRTASSNRELPSEMEDHEKENLEEFLKDIPSQVLSNAAFSIKAYARALQYFEVYLRQQPIQSHDRHLSSTRSFPVELCLISKHASYLQQLYSSCDEPDALIGLAALRRLYDAWRLTESAPDRQDEPDEVSSLTYLLHQVVDHEQLAQWEDALACYEQLNQEVQSVHKDSSSHFTIEHRPNRNVRHEIPTDPYTLKSDVYSGIARCHIQLGRLESALQHINGVVTQEPEYVGILYPHALECAWRLSRWDLVSDLLNTETSATHTMNQGGLSSRLRNLDVSQLTLVRVLHNFHNRDETALVQHLQEARLKIMGPLAAAAAESYQRAYPLLHKLHFLHEAEQGFIALQATKNVAIEARSEIWKEQCPWDSRYEIMPASLKFRDSILALRRVMLGEAELKDEVSHNWLLNACMARKEGHLRTANSAVMHAEMLDNPYASREKAKLFVAQDRMYEALQILEPVDIDAAKLDFNVDDPHYCAKNLLLATNWMQESGQRQGKKVIERYEAVIKFDPTWESGYFSLAKYYEYLLNVGHPKANTSASNSNGTTQMSEPIAHDMGFRSHLIHLMQNYVLALSHGTKHVFQSMPRLLTLWFEYGEILYLGAAKGNKINKAMRNIELDLSESTIEQQILSDITQIIQNATLTLPAYQWLVCLPQVISRICHPNPKVVEGVKGILQKVLQVYPTQAMWPLLGLINSLNTQRRNQARDIISKTQKKFVQCGEQHIANCLNEGMKLVEELVLLAGYDPGNQRKMRIQVTRIRTRILIPVQAALNTVLPASGLAPKDDKHTAFSPHSQIYIKAFSDKADVMMTKEKPKRIEILGSDGNMYPFLCKREKTGDLRKDARMMEFNTMINKLLQKDQEGRKRKLRLRTYAVVCLNEESGLMEWVRDTKAMRQLVGQIHKLERGLVQPMKLTHELKERFLGMQKTYADDIPKMAAYYRLKILSLPAFTPRFHQWFYNNFADPTGWYESRLVFTRSAAVWSMVGHIIGLGDRHGENILIDCTNGECVHVDFDCLFDKGLKLTKPEIVPFRLTPNMIDAFGITGYEGVFRRVCEVTMKLLRDNKETLRSVLEAFVHDPLVEWGRRGKHAQGASAVGRSITDISSDRSKEETRVILKTIDDRLLGVYNLGDAVRPLVSSSIRNVLPENDTLPLSVQGQVDKLIHEATSHENLAQMYIGWMPFL